MLAIAIGLIAITVAIYAPVRAFDYVQLDDPTYVAENAHVAGGLNWANGRWAFSTVHAGYWIPLTWLSYMLDVSLFGPGAGAQHVTNLVFHIVNTLLLFFVFTRLTGGAGRSAFVAAMFAAHPLHVESVAWITERKDVLSTLFLLLAVWAYARYARKPGFWRYFAVAVPYVLGLMAKPMVLTLPLVLLLLDFWPLGRLRLGLGAGGRWSGEPGPGETGARALLWEKVPLFCIALVSAVTTVIFQGQAVVSIQAIPVARRLVNATVSGGGYIAKMLWPVHLSPLYLLPQGESALSAVAPALVLATISLVAVRSAKRYPYLVVGWLWYLVTLLPVSGLIQSGLQSMADRFTYIPLIGLFVMAAWGVPAVASRWRVRREVLAVAATAAVLVCAALARVQLQYWKDSVVFWTRVTELGLGMDSYSAHLSLGRTLLDQGRLDEARGHFTEAVRLQPGSAEAHHGLGLALAALGQTDGAIESFREAVRLQPDVAEAHSDLGLALAERGRSDEATAELEESLRLKPDLAEAHGNLGSVLLNQERYAEALPHLLEAARLRPAFEGAHVDLGIALAKTGKTAEAVREFEEALRLNPQNAVARRARDELAARLKDDGRARHP